MIRYLLILFRFGQFTGTKREEEDSINTNYLTKVELEKKSLEVDHVLINPDVCQQITNIVIFNIVLYIVANNSVYQLFKYD